METIILIFHVLAAAGVIGLILIQQGKGAEAGASFGAGASQTVFGSSGSASFLSRTTAILATVFFVTSFSLAMVARQKANTISDAGVPAAAVQQQQAPQTSDAPVAIEGTAGGVESDAPVLDSTPVETDEKGQNQENDLPPVQ